MVGSGGGGGGAGFTVVVGWGAVVGGVVGAGRGGAVVVVVGGTVVVVSTVVEVVDVDVGGGRERPTATAVDTGSWLASAIPAAISRRATAAARPRIVCCARPVLVTDPSLLADEVGKKGPGLYRRSPSMTTRKASPVRARASSWSGELAMSMAPSFSPPRRMCASGSTGALRMAPVCIATSRTAVTMPRP